MFELLAGVLILTLLSNIYEIPNLEQDPTVSKRLPWYSEGAINADTSRFRALAAELGLELRE